MMRVLCVFLALLSTGCVATRMTDASGVSLTRISVGSDVGVKASRDKEGALSVEESQQQDAAQSLLELLNKALQR